MIEFRRYCYGCRSRWLDVTRWGNVRVRCPFCGSKATQYTKAGT